MAVLSTILAPFSRHNRASLRALLALFVPMLITQFSQAAYGLVDSIMVGRHSTVELAAISVGVGIWFCVFLLVVGIMQAAASLISAKVGQGNVVQLHNTIVQLLYVAVVVGGLGALVVLALQFVLPFIGTPSQLHPTIKLYLQGVALSMPAITVFAVLRSVAESMGKAKWVTLIVIASLLLLVPVNAAFIYGWGLLPAMGGGGVGVANTIVAWVSTLLLWVLLCVHPYFKHLSLTTLWPTWQWAQSKSILLLGLPIGLAIFFEASLFCLAAPIIAPLGTVPLASHQIALSVTSQLFMVPIALAMATTLLVGKLYGLGQYNSIVNVRNIVNGLAIWMAVLVMLLLWLGNSLLVKAYTTDITLQKIASNILLFAVAYQVFDALQVVAAGVLRGIQRPRYAMWATIVVYWGVGLPLGFVLTHYSSLGVYGFWLAVVVALLLAAVLLQRELARELRRLPAS